MRIFFYGIFRQGERGSRLGCEYIGPAQLNGWTLHCNGGVAFARPSGALGAHVNGDVYEVGVPALERFDQVEGHPIWYERVPVTLADGSAAQIYRGPEVAINFEDIGPDWRQWQDQQRRNYDNHYVRSMYGRNG